MPRVNCCNVSSQRVMQAVHHDSPARRADPADRRCCGRIDAMDTARSIALFVLAAVAEIGGAWLVWQGIREHRGVAWVGAGFVALGAYGLVATVQPSGEFGRILAAYGGVFVAGSLVWGVVFDRFRPD